MATLEWTVTRENGVTLVEAIVSREATPVSRDPVLSVTVESRLDGPVWPPRSDGVPVAGWSGDRFEATVPADRRVAVGFASPAAPTDPPVEIVDRRRGTVSSDGETAPSDVLRALGDPAPPRDAVSVTAPASEAAGAGRAPHATAADADDGARSPDAGAETLSDPAGTTGAGGEPR